LTARLRGTLTISIRKLWHPSAFKALLITQLTAIIVIQLLILSKTHEPTPANGYKNQLTNLVWSLHDKGLEFRAYSQRPDGLWDDGVYLTTTDKTFREIARVPANPDLLDQWKGTVAIYRMGSLPTNDSPYDVFGEDCLIEGDFVFFGDKELIRSIHQCLERP
jgi:hypothetical protein